MAAYCDLLESLASLVFAHPALTSVTMIAKQRDEEVRVSARLAAALARNRVLETVHLPGREKERRERTERETQRLRRGQRQREPESETDRMTEGEKETL